MNLFSNYYYYYYYYYEKRRGNIIIILNMSKIITSNIPLILFRHSLRGIKKRLVLFLIDSISVAFGDLDPNNYLEIKMRI